MPIRIHCPFCDQLLAISSKKVGTVVECPSCHGKVGVPSPDTPPAPPLVPLPPPPREIILGPGQLVALGVSLLLLAGLAFFTGLLVGTLG